MTIETAGTIASLEEIEVMSDRARELRTRLDTVRSRSQFLIKKLAGLVASGGTDSEEAGRVREERAALLREEEELSSALPILEGQITEGRVRTLEKMAVDRVRAIHRAISGSSGEQPARISRMKEAARVLSKEAEKVREAYRAQSALVAEERALRGRFPDLPSTSPKAMVPPLSEPGVRELLDELRTVLAFEGQSSRRREAPSDSPGAEILRLAGPSPEEIRRREVAAEKEQEREEEEERFMSRISGEIGGRNGFGF